MKTNTRSHLCRVFNMNGRVGGEFVCMFLPVWGLLHSVEAVVFMSTGSGGESVKTFMRGKQRKTNSLILVGGNMEGCRKDEFEWKSCFGISGGTKVMLQPDAKIHFKPGCPQTRDIGWAKTERREEEQTVSTPLSLPPLLIQQLNEVSIPIPTTSMQNTTTHFQYFWPYSDLLEQLLYICLINKRFTVLNSPQTTKLNECRRWRPRMAKCGNVYEKQVI